MNPLNWIRWKLLLLLIVVIGGFYLLGLDPLAHWKVNDLGMSSEKGARWNVEDISLGLLTGDFDFTNLLVATAREKGQKTLKNRVFSADRIQVDFNMNQLLRRRVHGSVEMEVPNLVVERQPDGTINVGDIGEEEPTPPEEKPTDWVKAIEEWAERLRKLDEKRRQGEAEREKEEKGEDRPPEDGKVAGEERSFEVDYSRRVTYPFEKTTRYVAEKIVGKGLEIHFKESGGPGGREIPPITDGELRIENLSEKPAHYPEPIRWRLAAKMAGAPIEISGHLDLRRADPELPPKNELRIDVNPRGAGSSEGIPMELANVFAGDSLPLRFLKGKLKLQAEVTILDFHRLNIQPSLGFVGVEVAPREGVGRIAGIDAEQFCRTFNEASRELEVLEINDLRVMGTFTSPEIHLGNTLKDLITSGAKAFARKQIDRGVALGKEKAGELLKDIGGSKEGTEAIQKTVEGAGKELEKGLRGIFGGDEKRKN